jgi:hypothetical protein
MTKLPLLHKSIQRKLDLQWRELTRSHGFPEEGLKLPDNRRADGELRARDLQVSHEWAIAEKLVKNTVGLAKMRFEQIAGEYLAIWASAEDASEIIAEWLVEIKAVVASELTDLWAKSEWHPSFQSRCLTKADEELSSLVNFWKLRATRLEIQKLENPHLSFESLLAVGGDANFATTLEEGKRTIEVIEQILNTLRTDALGPQEEGIGPSPSAQAISPGFVPSQQRMGGSILPVPIYPEAIASRQRVGSPIIHVDLFFPLSRHELIGGANGLSQEQSDALCKEIIRLANRIQALENPELPAPEAGDRWLDRLSITPRRVWEFKDVLTASAEFCTDFAIHMLRSGRRELASDFDSFAARFKALHVEYFPALISSPGADASPAAPVAVTEPRAETATSSLSTGQSASETERIQLPLEPKKIGRPPSIPAERKIESTSGPEASSPGDQLSQIDPQHRLDANDDVARRQQLLADYRAATGQPSNQSIYSAKNSGIHKPQFYQWLRGDLPASSQTTMNFERFLAEKKPPIRKKPKN